MEPERTAASWQTRSIFGFLLAAFATVASMHKLWRGTAFSSIFAAQCRFGVPAEEAKALLRFRSAEQR
jgi:hypothetical protein